MNDRRSAGFTLVELVAAIVLLAVAVPPMIWAMRQAEHDFVDPILTSRARWIATEKLEDVIADRHSQTRGYDFLVPANYPFEAVGSIPGFPGYSRDVSFSETTADLSTPGDGYMTVTVTVTWTGAAGQSRQTSLSTVQKEYTP